MLVIERPLGPRESRVSEEQRPIRSEREAIKLAGYWDDRVSSLGVTGHVLSREVSLWEPFNG